MMADIASKIAGEEGSYSNKPVQEADKLIDDFSSIMIPEEAGISDIQERLAILNENILTWDYDHSTSQSSPEEQLMLFEYVNEVQQLEEVLRAVKFANEEYEQNNLLNCAQHILQMVTEKLLEKFIDLLRQFHHEIFPLLVKDNEDLELDHKILIAPAEDVDDISSNSFDDKPVDKESHRFINGVQGSNPVELTRSSTISNLKFIATLLFQCGYGKECCQAYIYARKVALEDCLLTIGMETFGIEEILKMEWNDLNHTINVWKRAMKVFIGVCLVNDKRLCDIIFGELPISIGQSCFTDSSKCLVFQLLSFADAVAISAARPEKLFQILDIYEAIYGLLMHIKDFFPENYGVSISNECYHVVSRLSDSIKTIVGVFKYQILTSTSTTPFHRAGVHQITKYVMNYVKALTAYHKTVNLLLSDQPNKSQNSSLENIEECKSDLPSCPFSQYLVSVTRILESNLEEKSHLYNNDAMSNVFMMNNIFYMVQKVKNSDLCHFVSDKWIRVYTAKFQRHARDYQRASWTPVLSYLREEGYQGNETLPMKVIKQRFDGFNNAFEEVYRAQTGWVVPDGGLRDDLRISISSVLRAYRFFLGRYANRLESEKHRVKNIKYSEDDLEKYLLDLFEGSEKSLHHSWRR